MDESEFEAESESEADPYVVQEVLPTPDEFVTLRDVAGMTPRPRDAVERGLSESTYGVTVLHEPTGETVGMARIVGDGATVFHVCDMAVHPDHQRQGLGTRLMDALLAFIESEASPGAYVNLMADVDGFYERFGFEETRPASKGMYLRVE